MGCLSVMCDIALPSLLLSLALPSPMLTQVLEFGLRMWDIQKCDPLDSLSFVRWKERSGERVVPEREISFKPAGRRGR